MNALSSIRAALGRMTIGAQLYAGFGAVIVLMAAQGALALLALTRADERSHLMSDKWMVSVDQLARARAAIVEAREFEVKHSRTADRSYQAEYEEKAAAAAKVVDTALASYQALPAEADEAQLVAELVKAWAGYQKASQRVIGLGRDKKQQDAADISDGVASMAVDETLGALSQLTQHGFDTAKRLGEVGNTESARARATVLALLAGGLVVAAVLALVITRSLLRQLGGEPGAAAALARAVAEGDLTTAVALRPGDERSLMASLQAMQRGLARAVTQVRQGSEGVATASSQIAEGNHDLSGRTEQQASALQQTSATMEQLGTTVRHNADSARQANELAQGAATVAVKGGEVVGQVVQTMRGINDSSRRIADIIAVIDGIAFQTNILALNAAVEAARAGEQGRGFAVVAAEVRNLAQRSAEAAREIKSLITASVERVEQGSTLVDQAGRTMDEIVAAIGRVSGIVGEISSASSEQSSGVNQVSQAVSQMDQATQQNAALVEQSAAAAEALRQQAQQLVQAVAVFRLA